jgi:hypothetical protein
LRFQPTLATSTAKTLLKRFSVSEFGACSTNILARAAFFLFDDFDGQKTEEKAPA